MRRSCDRTLTQIAPRLHPPETRIAAEAVVCHDRSTNRAEHAMATIRGSICGDGPPTAPAGHAAGSESARQPVALVRAGSVALSSIIVVALALLLAPHGGDRAGRRAAVGTAHPARAPHRGGAGSGAQFRWPRARTAWMLSLGSRAHAGEPRQCRVVVPASNVASADASTSPSAVGAAPSPSGAPPARRLPAPTAAPATPARHGSQPGEKPADRRHPHRSEPEELKGYNWPLYRGRMTNFFGARYTGFLVVDGQRIHPGLDTTTFCGDRVRAAHAGVVVAVGRRFAEEVGFGGPLDEFYRKIQRRHSMDCSPSWSSSTTATATGACTSTSPRPLVKVGRPGPAQDRHRPTRATPATPAAATSTTSWCAWTAPGCGSRASWSRSTAIPPGNASGSTRCGCWTSRTSGPAESCPGSGHRKLPRRASDRTVPQIAVPARLGGARRAAQEDFVDDAFRTEMTQGYALTQPGVPLGSPMLAGELLPEVRVQVADGHAQSPRPHRGRHGHRQDQDPPAAGGRAVGGGHPGLRGGHQGRPDGSRGSRATPPTRRSLDRAQSMAWTFTPAAHPVEFLSLSGKLGAQVRASVHSFGPLLLGKVLDLNPTQTSILSLVFKYCDDKAPAAAGPAGPRDDAAVPVLGRRQAHPR